VITCKPSGKKTVKIKCSIALVSPHAARARLVRSGRVMASGWLLRGTLELSVTHALVRGRRYTLEITAGGHTRYETVVIR
jgi:hemin uptake protein HemP